MRKIELYPGIQSSLLGFGCASIKGAVSGRVAKRAIDCALDCGINHFDLARSYGYGEAEQFVGRLLKEKRKKLIIASKFGLESTRAAILLKPVKPIVRYIRKRSSEKDRGNQENNKTTSVLARFTKRVILNENEMRRSLEESLFALKTNYLDYFFVHEPQGKINNIEELKYVADCLKKEGKIRAWGLAFKIENISLHQDYLDLFDVLQFNPAPEELSHPLFLDIKKNKKNILFSPLRNNKNLSPEEKFNELLTQYPQSIILPSMFNEKHIIENSALFLD